MKKPTLALALALALAAPVFAADTKPAAAAASGPKLSAQNARMADCNKEAGDKKGDERKAFMSQCLKAKKVTQQGKMTACNKEAGDKKGDERKAFMKQCLSA